MMVKAFQLAARAGVIVSLLSCGAAATPTHAEPKVVPQTSADATASADKLKKKLQDDIAFETLAANGDFEAAKQLGLA